MRYDTHAAYYSEFNNSKIQSQLLYPASGMLSMALEAVNQLVGLDQKIANYNIRNASFHTAMIIPFQRSIEVQISLRPEKENLYSCIGVSWYNFRIYSFKSTTSVEHCFGSVGVKFEKMNSEVIDEKLDHDELCHYQDVQKSAEEICSQKIASKTLYRSLQETGYNYGPRFRALEDISYGPRSSVARVNVSHRELPQGSQIIHPSVLDAFMQLLLVPITCKRSNSTDPKVPTFLERLWLSGSESMKNLEGGSQTYLKGSATLTSDNALVSKGDIYIINYSDGSIFAKLGGLTATTVPSTKSSAGEKNMVELATTMCRRVTWKPDLTLLSREEQFLYLKELQREKPVPVEKFDQLDCFLYLAIAKTARLLKNRETLPSPTITKYAKWIVDQDNFAEEHDARTRWKALRDDVRYFEQLCVEVKSTSFLGLLCLRIWESMPQLLGGEVDPLSLLFQDDLLSNAYEELNRTSNWCSSIRDITSHLEHQNGSMKVLEVGAGTGATTRLLLEALSSSRGANQKASRHFRYDFTDISSGFFENAQSKFEKFKGVNFLTLDIEKDPGSQGFELHSYDLVVASLVRFPIRSEIKVINSLGITCN